MAFDPNAQCQHGMELLSFVDGHGRYLYAPSSWQMIVHECTLADSNSSFHFSSACGPQDFSQHFCHFSKGSPFVSNFPDVRASLDVCKCSHLSVFQSSTRAPDRHKDAGRING